MVRQCAVALANHDVQQSRILHHNTRAEGVIQNFPWRAEWNIIPQDIAAELTCMKKQWLLKDPPVLSGGEVVPSEQFTKPSFSIHVHCATSGKERYSGADG